MKSALKMKNWTIWAYFSIAEAFLPKKYHFWQELKLIEIGEIYFFMKIDLYV